MLAVTVCPSDWGSSSPHDLASFSLGTELVCAMKKSGSVLCWGMNHVGQLGAATNETCMGNLPCSTKPIPVQF